MRGLDWFETLTLWVIAVGLRVLVAYCGMLVGLPGCLVFGRTVLTFRLICRFGFGVLDCVLCTLICGLTCVRSYGLVRFCCSVLCAILVWWVGLVNLLIWCVNVLWLPWVFWLWFEFGFGGLDEFGFGGIWLSGLRILAV